MGAKVIDVPVVHVVPRLSDARVARALADLDSVGALAFTSVTAVDLFFHALRGVGRDARALAGRVVAATTPSVADALEAHGIGADVDVSAVRESGLAEALASHGVRGSHRVLIPRSSAAGPGIVEDLKGLGLDPVPLVLYETVPANLGWLGVKISQRPPQAIIFLSGSGVDAVLDAVPDLASLSPSPIWACIGRRTASVLAKRGIAADVVPGSPDVDLLVDRVVEKMTHTPMNA